MVSIQPKPKKGLEDYLYLDRKKENLLSFNPAEAEEGFRSRPYLTISYSIVYANTLLQIIV